MIGSVVTAATISFHQARRRASHQAIGVARMSNRTVVRPASLSVVQTTSATYCPPPLVLANLVAVLPDDRHRLRAFQEGEEGLGRGVVLAGLQQDGLLIDGRVVGGGHDPARAAGDVD